VKNLHQSGPATDPSRITEDGRVRKLSVAGDETVRIGIRNELAALDKYEALHGSFPELVRLHYP
jgi:hypothetical protein